MIPAHLVTRYAGRGPRYTSYPPVPAWTGDVGPDTYETALVEAAEAAGPVALYVHLPFCAVRCWYCACNVQIQVSPAPVNRYLDRVEREIAEVSSLIGRRPVNALHLGGGTPNFLTDAQLQRLVSALQNAFDIEPGAERAIELDSRVANEGDMERIVGLGFRRLSFGVQDLSLPVGHSIGRITCARRLGDQIREARDAGADGVNVDLLYGLPQQTPVTLARTMEVVANDLSPDRIAFYGYAHVPWMRPQQRRLETAGLPNADERLELFMEGLTRLTEYGYVPVGMDHFARPEDPLLKARDAGTLGRSFMGYTTTDAPDLIGLGASSIGFLSSARRPTYVQNATAAKPYQRAVGLATVRGHVLTADDERRAAIIASILCQFEVRSSPDFDLWSEFPHARRRLERFEQDGLVRIEPDALTVTELGHLFLRPIAMVFDAAVPQPSETRYSATV